MKWCILCTLVASAVASFEAFAQAPDAAQGQQQPAETPVAGQMAESGGDTTPGPTLAEVEAALAAIEANTAIEDGVKDLLRPKYKQAIKSLKAAADFANEATAYRGAIQTAPQSAAAVRAELQALPSADDVAKTIPTGTAQDLQKDIESRRAVRSGLKDELSKTAGELVRVEGRPAAISVRLPEAQRELLEVREELESLGIPQDVTSSGRLADRVVLRAQQARLLSELDMMKHEQLSQAVREDLLQAQHKLLTRQVENAAAALATLDALLRQRLANDVDRITSLAETLAQNVPQGDQAAQTLAAEAQLLAMQFEGVVESSKKVKQSQGKVTNLLDNLTSEYDSVREQLELGDSGKAMVQVFFDLNTLTLNAHVDVNAVQVPALNETRLAALEIRDQLRRQPEVEREFADHPADAVAQLVAVRREVLEKLRSQYGNLIRSLAALKGGKERYLHQAEEVRDYISEQLFGFKVKSCSPFSFTTLTDLPGDLWWAMGWEHWQEFGQALLGSALRVPLLSFGVFSLAALLLFFRRRMAAALERTGAEVRRISTDRYARTGEALLWTLLLAIPLPLLLGFADWALEQTSNPSDWLRGLAGGLEFAAQAAFTLVFLAAVCRVGGLGASHFGWNQEILARFRTAIYRFLMVYIPTFLLTCSCVYGSASAHFDSLGRICFILGHAWLAVILWQLFQGSNGVIAMYTREHPTGFIARGRRLWLPLLMAAPIFLVVFACRGYLLTAVEFSLGFLRTAVLVAGGCISYGLAERWFTMKQRKLALSEAIERRRLRQEAATSNPQEQSDEIVSVDLQEEEEGHLDSISVQTRRLLRLLFSLAVGAAIIIYWSRTFPLIEVVDSIRIPRTDGLTLLELLEAVLIGLVTYITVRNLPGLLELGVLRAKMVEAGTRHAISTLCQYAVTAIGLTLVLNTLEVDWEKFGWIAAALSVGLGFGLQEVVANFVCGLIVLLERPIRVGDVVTLEGMTGTVTRIQMRATTITNWDRQEFVVPNKTLITSTLLNWTLSAPLNRILIPVGVAYGSDTEKAQQILVDVAVEHPRVLDDPAPTAAFEEFADSTLNLMLRAYLPNLENRIETITDLHTEIDKRFAAAGIEIAFPQQDIHLRSGWDELRGTSNLESEG